MKKKDTSWGKVATWYEGMVADDDSYQMQVIAPNLLRLIDLKSNEKVLDLACGTGFFSGIFAKIVGPKNITGLDVGKPLIAIAKKSYPEIDFRVSSADELSIFPDQHFDKVAIVLAIQNIEEVKSMLTEINRVVKRQGLVYIVMNHPAFRIPKRSGWGFDEVTSQQYRRVDGYLRESKEEIDMKPGSSQNGGSAQLTVSFHRPLQYYTKLFSATGFAITRLEEWISHRRSQTGPRQKEEDRMRSEIPLFLFIEIQKK
ncbi:TPA: SAM-dependent methyltransferase [Candidatus Taylorbacteria bacterium]|nr:SAM-dependent methyltransferase [Candidatus Taylorbacteria bacterium]